MTNRRNQNYRDEFYKTSTGGGGVTDHGVLTGLGDNDHPQYRLTSVDIDLSEITNTGHTHGLAHITNLYAYNGDFLSLGNIDCAGSIKSGGTDLLTIFSGNQTGQFTGDTISVNFNAGTSRDGWLKFYDPRESVTPHLKWVEDTNYAYFELNKHLDISGNCWVYEDLYLGEGLNYVLLRTNASRELEINESTSVDGNLSATGVIYSGSVDISTMMGSGGGSIPADLEVQSLSVTGDGSTGIITFPTSKTFRWDGSNSRFLFNANTTVLGLLAASNVDSSTDLSAAEDIYLNSEGENESGAVYFHDGTSPDGHSISMASGGSMVEFSTGASVNGSLALVRDSQTVFQPASTLDYRSPAQIQITLPNGASGNFNTSADWDIELSVYAEGGDGRSAKVFIHGQTDHYTEDVMGVPTNYAQWKNVSAFVCSEDTSGRFNVGFYADRDLANGGNAIITIGETDTVWSNLSVTIDKVTTYDTEIELSDIEQGWDITLSASTPYSGHAKVYHTGTTLELERHVTVLEPRSDENIGLGYVKEAISLSNAYAVLRGSSSPSVTYQLYTGSTRSSGTQVFSGTVTSTTTESQVTTTAEIPADSFWWLQTSATGGTVESLELTIYYKRD